MSRTITISVPHSLGQQMALERVASLCNQIRAQYADRMKVTKEVWTGNRLDFAIEALTRTVSGAIDVEDNAVAIAVDLLSLAISSSSQFNCQASNTPQVYRPSQVSRLSQAFRL